MATLRKERNGKVRREGGGRGAARGAGFRAGRILRGSEKRYIIPDLVLFRKGCHISMCPKTDGKKKNHRRKGDTLHASAADVVSFTHLIINALGSPMRTTMGKIVSPLPRRVRRSQAKSDRRLGRHTSTQAIESRSGCAVESNCASHTLFRIGARMGHTLVGRFDIEPFSDFSVK